MKFTEAQLEKAFAELLENEKVPHRLDETISPYHRNRHVGEFHLTEGREIIKQAAI